MRTLPLSGRTVVITRPHAKSGGVAAALAMKGAKVIRAPLIEIVPPRSFRALDRAIKTFSRYDAVAFTSVNAVHFFFLRCRKILGRAPRSPRILSAVGRATANAVAVHGWGCSVIPEDARSAALARILRVPRGSRVLIPSAERGLPTLSRSLRKNGARVTVAAAYRTVPDKTGRHTYRRALANSADAVLFASPSAAALGAADCRLAGAAAVAIGPTTAAALRARGLAPFVSKRPDAESFARATALALRGRP